MKIAVSTDTSSAINLSLAQKLGIYVFPLNVIVDGEEFLDGVSINQEQLAKDMREGKKIKTSTPPPGDIITYFEKIFNEGYEKVIHFTISSKLSSMNQLFNNVSRDYFDNKIIVIDSYSLCAAMLSQVLFGYEEVNKGTDVEVIVKEVEKIKEGGQVIFIPENLTALKNGGRISPAVAALGNMIGLKPILTVQDGALEKVAMTRNMKKSFSEIILELLKTYPLEGYDYNIASFDGNESTITYIKGVIENILEGYKCAVVPIAINVCAHCGPGTIGLIVTPHLNGHSINDLYLL